MEVKVRKVIDNMFDAFANQNKWVKIYTIENGLIAKMEA